jgi:regulator of replication initiation timing
MSDEQAQAPVESNASPDINAELEALRRKNKELLDEAKRAKAKARDIPDDVNVQELIDFKRKAEQAEAERKGQYDDALKVYEQQFRDREAKYLEQISSLEAEVRMLKLDSRVVSKLADQVHDPEAVLRLEGDKLTLNDAGEPVIKDGYNEVPLDQWVADLQQRRPYLFKQASRPVGTGAPAARASASIPAGMKNPFSKEHFNLTEQGRLFKTNPELYAQLKAEAKR